MTPECAAQHTRSEHLPWDVHGEARVLPSVQTDTQVANRGVNDSLPGASSCERSQLCPCKQKRGRAAAAAPLTEQGLNQPGRGWGSSELQTPNTRDMMTSGTREMMGAHMGGSQTQGAPPAHPQPLSAPVLLLPRDSTPSHPFLLFLGLFPPFLIQIPSLTQPAYYSFPLQSQEPSMAGPVLCSLFFFTKQAGWFPLSDLQSFQTELPGHHSSPGSGLGSSCPAPVPKLCLQISFPFCSGTNTCTEQGEMQKQPGRLQNWVSPFCLSEATPYCHLIKFSSASQSQTGFPFGRCELALSLFTSHCRNWEQSYLHASRQPRHWAPHPDLSCVLASSPTPQVTSTAASLESRGSGNGSSKPNKPAPYLAKQNTRSPFSLHNAIAHLL